MRAVTRGTTAAVVASWRLRARLTRSALVLDVDPTAVVERGAVLRARGASTLRLGPGAVVERGATVLLKGGAVELGAHTRVRSGAVLNVSGELRCGGRNLISWGAVVHCADRVDIGERAVLAEHASVVDSTHRHGGPDEWFYENVETAPVHIGPNSWLGAKSTVTRGVTIGADVVIGAGSVVNADVADGTTVVGAPARPVTPRQQG